MVGTLAALGPTMDYEADAIYSRFRHCAEVFPEAEAIRSGSRVITYKELLDSVDRVGSAISKFHAPGSTLGIYGRRTSDAVVAMLGCARSGVAFVSLWAEYPAARLKKLAEDASLAGIIATEAQADLSGITDSWHDFDALDSMDEDILRPNGVGPADIAYIIYTSGSTGAPKGVEVTHDNCLTLVCGQHYARFEPGSSFLQLAPYSFDASMFEIFGALLNGGSLILPGATYADLSGLADIIESSRPTNLLLTPVLFRELLSNRPDCFEHLSRLLVGGDAILSQDVRNIRRLDRGAALELWNVYGPTEATTLVVGCDLADVDLTDGPPLGRAIRGTELHVLDEQLQPTPTGEVGELYLSGESLTRGYRGATSLTAAAFVASVDPERPGARMYRTGDLVYIDTSGSLHFRGRSDDQVNIRGHRVEIREVETSLLRVPFVEACAVAAVRLSGDHRQLVAWVTVDPSAPSEVGSTVRTMLAESMPGYMVPSRVVEVRELPQTTAGKIDRRRLEENLQIHPWSIDAERVEAPAIDDRAALLGIWREVLGHPLTESDNFFSCGGDSILAVRAVAQAAERGLHTSLDEMLASPTVASITIRREPDGGVAVPGIGEDDRAALLGIWQEVLGHPLTESDNFFSCGGDSILAVRAVAQAAERGLHTSLDEMLGSPTVASITIRREPDGGEPSAAAPNSDPGRRRCHGPVPSSVPAHPATAMQMGMLAADAMNSSRSIYRDAIIRRISLPFDMQAFESALANVAERNHSLRTTFDLTSGTGPLQVVGDVGPSLGHTVVAGLPFEEVQVLRDSIVTGVREPFDVEAGPLMRVHVLSAKDHFDVIYGFHHAILDGWSDTVFVSELLNSYRSTIDPQYVAEPVVAKPSIAQVSDLERAAIGSSSQSEFWAKASIDQSGPWLACSADGVSLHERRVSSEHVQQLRSDAVAAGVGLRNIFLAVHCAVLGEAFGLSRVTTTWVTNTRPEASGADRMIGCFLNVLPVTVDTSHDVRRLARSLFEEEVASSPYRRYPYQAMVHNRLVKPVASSFNFTNFHLANSLFESDLIDQPTVVDRTSFPISFDVQMTSDQEATIVLTLPACDDDRCDETRTHAAIDSMPGALDEVLGRHLAETRRGIGP